MIDTMPNFRLSDTYEIHRIELPVMCPVSKNPKAGSHIRILYKPKDKLLEVYSLKKYVDEYIGGHPSGVRDMEQTIQKIAKDCSEAVGVEVKVYANLILDTQRLYLRCSYE
jgi:7-cyano-7-deazaguanine reductase